MNPTIGIPAWLVACIGAFNLSLEFGLSTTIGVFGQWFLGSTTRVDNRVAVAVTMALAVGAYALLNHPALAWSAEEWRHWATAALQWALAALGAGSAAGKTGGAPATNSRGPGATSPIPEGLMKTTTTVLLLALTALLFATPSHAAKTDALKPVLTQQFMQVAPGAETTNPWYSVDNLSIAVGASYGWWAGGDAVVISPRKEFVFGIYNAWMLTEHFDAIGNVEYGVDSKIRGFKLGLRFIAKAPK